MGKEFAPFGYEFGHKVYFDGIVWRYYDDDSIVDYNKPRRFPLCNKYPAENSHDPCIANLPGVEYACCGHGIEGESYIKFIDGRIIVGTFRMLDGDKDE